MGQLSTQYHLSKSLRQSNDEVFEDKVVDISRDYRSEITIPLSTKSNNIANFNIYSKIQREKMLFGD